VSRDLSPPLHSLSVAAAVVDADRVLVVPRRDNGRWEPPGGILELGESIPDGLRREVREETGLTVEPDALTGVYKNLARGVVALVFRCRATGGEPAATAEAHDFRWMHRHELAALVTPAYAVWLTDALDYAGTPAVEPTTARTSSPDSERHAGHSDAPRRSTAGRTVSAVRWALREPIRATASSNRRLSPRRRAGMIRRPPGG